VFKPKWSAHILTELPWTWSKRPASVAPTPTGRIRQMQRASPEAGVKGYEDLFAKMTNGPLDRHMPAAAVKSGARELVTFNLKDLPASVDPAARTSSCPAIPVAC
jgi:hypothetical protein